MEYNNFEKHISETLRHDEVSLDINALIQDIHAEKPRRRIPFLILFSTALTLSGLLGTYLYLKIDTNSSEIKKHLVHADVDKNGSKSVNQTVNSSSVMSLPLSNNKFEGIKTQKSDIFVKPKHLAQSNIYQSSIDLKNAKWSNGKQQISSNKISELSSESKVNTTISDMPANIENTLEATTARSMNGFNIAPMSHALKGIYSTKYGKIKSGNIVCPTFNKKGKFFFELIPEIGYFRPIKKLEQTGNEPDNIFALRSNNETTLEGLNAGLYLRMGKEKLPFFFQVGASVSRMTEKMPLDYSYTKRDTTRGIISITQSQSGDTLTVIFGDIVQETKISGKKTNHHHFTLIDFPLSAGYEKRFGQWAAGIEGGVELNMSLKASGQILASDTSFTAIDAPIQAYRSRLGMSYFGGLYVSRDFYEAGRFIVSLRGRYIPGTFSGDQNKIRQSYHFLGLNLGYIYSF